MKFPGSFNLFTAFNLFLKKLQRIFLAPFKLLFQKFLHLVSPQNIVGKVSEDIRGEVKQITKKPASIEEYFLIGDKYVAKKLVFVLVILFIIILALIIKLGIPFIQAKFFTKTLIINSVEVQNYTGKVKLINNRAEKRILYVGRLEEGRINGYGKLYDYQGNLVYRGGFVDAMYSGYGELYYPDGSICYKGSFALNKYEGYGLSYSSGSGNSVYRGTFS